MDAITSTAKTLDEAITKASIKLETSSNNIDYEIIEKGSAGFLGIGAKPVTITARIKEEEIEQPVGLTLEEQPKTEDEALTAEKSEKSVSKSEDIDSVQKKVRGFLADIFKAMGAEVAVDMSYNEAEKELSINLTGNDMGILIGKRGQTLDSLQYLISLIANREFEGYLRVKLDTENYRQRRKETLESLAKNIAYKVKRTRRSVALEPMNPYERRIIHSVLQNDKYVVTKSEGEDPFRHVVVILKKENYKKESY